MTTPTDVRVQELLDKQDIADLLARYMRAADRGDVDTLRACYLPGATEDHGGVFAGPASDYVDMIATTVSHPRSLTTHVLSNVLVEVDGDRATSEAYVTAFARVRTPEGPGDALTCARLLDRLERCEGRWGIAHRQLLWEWNLDVPSNETWVFGQLGVAPEHLTRGAKHPADPVYGGAA